jgi:small-conductance mechanosensitive channel
MRRDAPGRQFGVWVAVLAVVAVLGSRLWAAPASPIASGTPDASTHAGRAAPASVAPEPTGVRSAPSPAAVSGGPSTSVKIEAGALKQAPKPVDRQAILSFLSEVIRWRQGLEVEEASAREPGEVLFAADDRQMADDVVKLSFEYARAAAALLGKEAAQKPQAPGGASAAAQGTATPGLFELTERKVQAEDEVRQAQSKVKALRARLAKAPARTRTDLTRSLVNAEGELELAQSRLDALKIMVDFEAASEKSASAGTGLLAQIDELERSVSAPAQPAGEKEKIGTAAAGLALPKAAAVAPPGILGSVENLLALRREEELLAQRVKLTQALQNAVDGLRAPLLQALREVNQQARALAAQGGAGDLAAIKQRKAEFEELLERYKLDVNALLPLAKEKVTLRRYSPNLQHWENAVDQRQSEQLRALLARLIGLAILLGAVLTGAMVWRYLIVRYIQEPRRRSQFLQLRRFALVLVVVLIVIFDFANELGSLATVLGFAAAGIAVALQNVILSLAGYFYISGRFGIKAGDRVLIAGVNGDVVDVGLFKLTLLEVTNDGERGQPTGRVVVFPNSIVFQGTGNFFKQIPGTNFVWNEVKLTLAPDCDYRLVEKRLIDVVNEVFARYRNAVQREYLNVERELNVQVESPRPHSRLYLSPSGIELVIRYPAQRQNAAHVADEVSRRLVDVLKSEPGLRLATQGTPNIESATSVPEPAPEPQAEAAAPDGKATEPAQAEKTASDTASPPKAAEKG